MENENSNEEPLINEDPINDDVNKKEKRAAILKQLDNKKLYPIQERIGIYIIAILSIVGLVLIGYTGVRAITLYAANNGTVISGVDSKDVYNMLDELDLEEATEDEIPEIEHSEPTNEYVETDEDELQEDEPEVEEDVEPDDEDTTTTSATITANLVGLRREAGSADLLAELYQGDVVEVIDLDYNPFWAHVSHNGTEGFVDRGFIELN